ncbi:hypothetical protein PRUPE_8G079300 [Prunus persica]|uniref:Uncharacterized protein n=1 Tax=Prunus persica TaxID=3760 RepID=A0A251MUU6_PRUPE|nr:hypothetical protein PRUPE_8G079300 [Prunus persica]
MGFRLPGTIHAKKTQVPSKSLDVPKGYFAVYVGESQKKRFVIPLSYLNQSSLLTVILNKFTIFFLFLFPSPSSSLDIVFTSL